MCLIDDLDHIRDFTLEELEKNVWDNYNSLTEDMKYRKHVNADVDFDEWVLSTIQNTITKDQIVRINFTTYHYEILKKSDI